MRPHHGFRPRSDRGARLGAVLLATLLGAPLACSNVEKAKPGPQASRAAGSLIEVPPILRGTVAQEALVDGFESVVVRGYGLVVALNGTGGAVMPPDVRAFMLAEMTRRGVGRQTEGLGGIDPDALLNSPDTAVVIVEGVIPPGAVGKRVRRGVNLPGTAFDVRVIIDPRTDASSLEGGRLFTTELRPVKQGEVFPPTGSTQASPLAEARGPIIVNPFSETSGSAPTLQSRIGRIQSGGEVARDLPIKLRLAIPSHARAQILQSVINTRFPQEPGQPDPTARGESAESIRITVPRSYREDPETFVRLLLATSIRQTRSEAIARSVKQVLVDDPVYAEDAAWRFEALGPKALPTVRELYDFPGEIPRLTAMRVGARLADPLVVPPLIDMSRSGSPSAREESVRLMGESGPDARLELALVERLDDEALDVRLAAYESLELRGSPVIDRLRLANGSEFHVVESTYPLLYVTQVGDPRLVLFGRDLALAEPIFADVGEGRFIIRSIEESDAIEVFRRTERGERLVRECGPRIVDLVRLMGGSSSAAAMEPGLGLSYGETLGILYALSRSGAVKVDFRSEQDRVLAAINRQREEGRGEVRPEFTPVEGEPGAAEPDYLLPPPTLDPAEDG